MPWEQPLDELADYFGEKVTLYFALLGDMTRWLLVLGACGALVEVDSEVGARVVSAAPPLRRLRARAWGGETQAIQSAETCTRARASENLAALATVDS